MILVPGTLISSSVHKPASKMSASSRHQILLSTHLVYKNVTFTIPLIIAICCSDQENVKSERWQGSDALGWSVDGGENHRKPLSCLGASVDVVTWSRLKMSFNRRDLWMMQNGIIQPTQLYIFTCTKMCIVDFKALLRQLAMRSTTNQRGTLIIQESFPLYVQWSNSEKLAFT